MDGLHPSSQQSAQVWGAMTPRSSEQEVRHRGARLSSEEVEDCASKTAATKSGSTGTQVPSKPGAGCWVSAHRGRVSLIERWDICPHAWRMGDRLPRRHLPVEEGAAGCLLPADSNGGWGGVTFYSKQTNKLFCSKKPKTKKEREKERKHTRICLCRLPGG